MWRPAASSSSRCRPDSRRRGIVFHGNNKSEAGASCRARRRRRPHRDRLETRSSIVSSRSSPKDSAGAARACAGHAGRRSAHARVHRDREPKIRSSGSDSRAATRSPRCSASSPTGSLTFAGIHCHIGSQVFRLDSFARAVEKMVGLVRAIEETTGATIDELNVGGGLGVRYLASDAPPTIDAYASVLQESVAKSLADAGVRSRPLLMVEPGRSIAAPAGSRCTPSARSSASTASARTSPSTAA